MLKIKIGNHNSNQVDIITKDNHCRTDKQYEAFKRFIDEHPGIVFFCNNPFKKDRIDEKYNCTFKIIFYKTTGHMHTVNITPTGRIKNFWGGNDVDMSMYGMDNEQVKKDALIDIQKTIKQCEQLGLR